MADLQLAAEHYHYEVRMLVATLHGFLSLQQTPEDRRPDEFALLHNALLEGVLLHARVLIEFHLPRMSDDITPAMFLQDKISDDATTKRLREAKNRIDKRLVHLTTTRSKPFAGWELVALVGDVLDTVERFLKAVAAAHPERAQWFEPANEAHRTFFEDHPDLTGGARPSGATG